ncbi:MAG: M1 family metallopeptidase, partial [Candidatus Binataceae bacterium]
LNEAFATFMEMLAVDAWKPEWKRWESFLVSRAAAMAVDGLKSTRPIEFMVNSPEDARAMFDILTYEKGAAALRMLEQYLGAEAFRKGIALYLKKHQYSNTETGDLWDALAEPSKEPVRKIMDSWIFQPGFPIVEVESAKDGRALSIRQRRFYYLPQSGEGEQLWQVPVMVRAKTEQGVATHKLLVGARTAELELGGRCEWALLNEGGHGFYRVRYAPALLDALTKNLGELRPVERFGLVSDTWAATIAGLAPLADFIRMARLFTAETDINVWRALLGAFGYLDMIASDADRPALAALVRDVVGPAAERMGWEARAGESELERQLRGNLVSAMGTLGEDAAVQRRAAELYNLYEDNPAKLDRDLAPALVNILAHAGDEKRFEEFARKFKSAPTPQEEQRYRYALAGFRKPELLRRTMEMTLDGQVRTQDAPYLLHSLLLNTTARYEAWDFMRKNWDEMTKRWPDSALPRMCEGVIALLDRDEEVRKFFEEHKMRLGGRLIDQHLERLAVAVAFRKREGAQLATTLKGS